MSTLLSKKLWGLMLLVVAEVRKIEGTSPTCSQWWLCLLLLLFR